MSFQLKYGPWAIVTGASAGLGEHYARQLAERGLNLIIIARRGDLLEELAVELIAIHKVDIECLALDLTADDAIDKVIAACSDKDVGLLVNNAGFGLKNEFIQNPPQRLRDMVRLNCEVPVLLSHALIQKMANRDSSGIINLASVAGFQPTPFMSVYGASKGFDLLFSEGLSCELENHAIDVLAVCPGSTDTEFHSIAGLKPTFPKMDDPRQVVYGSLNRLGKSAVYVHGFKHKFLILLSRLVPRAVVAKIAKSMVLKN